jgi:uncharacterized protein (DUF697 family)/predicted GTPase
LASKDKSASSLRQARNWIRNKILFPTVDDESYRKSLKDIRERLPVPVIWLLGKTQSGKTSIIQALTGHPRAEIGNGFQPCTRTSSLFSFPSEQTPIVHFLDTRGLGEIGYDPQEDLQLFLRGSHLLIVVVKVMDHALEPLKDALKIICPKRPNWPVLVVQTNLHEGYGNQEATGSVPQNLMRSLKFQQQELSEWTREFVAVDLTQPNDGYIDSNYGLEALWQKIEMLLPTSLHALIQGTPSLHRTLQDVHSQSAHPQIIAHSLLAGGVELLPIPLVSLPMVASIQARMFQALASIYRQQVSWRSFVDFLSAIGLGMMLHIGGRELIKFIPVYGTIVSSLYTAAATYALGKTMCLYLHHQRLGSLPKVDELREIYESQFKEGREILEKFISEKKKG